MDAKHPLLAYGKHRFARTHKGQEIFDGIAVFHVNDEQPLALRELWRDIPFLKQARGLAGKVFVFEHHLRMAA